jgi:hypothetical protein
MSRRYEPPSGDVTAIQNSALASSPTVEINEDFSIGEAAALLVPVVGVA